MRLSRELLHTLGDGGDSGRPCARAALGRNTGKVKLSVRVRMRLSRELHTLGDGGEEGKPCALAALGRNIGKVKLSVRVRTRLSRELHTLGDVGDVGKPRARAALGRKSGGESPMVRRRSTKAVLVPCPSTANLSVVVTSREAAAASPLWGSGDFAPLGERKPTFFARLSRPNHPPLWSRGEDLPPSS
jgi:hypothetical protein